MNGRRMNKKGQVFLIIAIILCVFMFEVMREYNKMNEDKGLENFEDMSDNYNNELTKIKNKAQLEGGDPNKEAQKFTDVYLAQMEEIDPNFGVISIFKDPVTGDIIIRNSMLSGDWITIKSDVASQGQVVLSGYDTMDGTISIEGMGNIGNTHVSTDLNTYGEEISELKLDPSVQNIMIQIGDTYVPITVPTDSSASMNILTSYECPEGYTLSGAQINQISQCIREVQINS